MKKLLTVTAIMVGACLTQGYTPKVTAPNSHTTSAKPTFNYEKFMRSLWVDARQSPRAIAPRFAFTFTVENWTDSKANIDYIWIGTSPHPNDFTYLYAPGNPPDPISEGEWITLPTWPYSTLTGDLTIGITITGPTEGGDRVVWFATNGAKNCQGNVLSNGEVVFPNVTLGNNNGYTIGVFENCP